MLVVSFVSLGLRAGIIVALSVPLTLAAVFIMMGYWGMELERISLGALILALGLLVDDAIIAIEAMVVKLDEGWDRVRAAAFAWGSTAGPMLSGTLVTMAGFIPVGFAASTFQTAGLTPHPQVRLFGYRQRQFCGPPAPALAAPIV